MGDFDLLFATELLVIFVLGLCIGSFLNVCSFRIAQGQSIVRPGSFCQNCKTPIRMIDNIPILSYVLLRGRCRHCRVKLSPQYPIVEAIMGILCVLIALGVGLDLRTLRLEPMAPRLLEASAWLSFCFFVVLIAVIDHRTGLVPDVVSLPGIGLGLVLITLLGTFGGASESYRLVASPFARSPLDSVLGIVIGGGLFLVIVLLSKGRMMGGGDVRIGALFGAYLGFRLALLSVLVGSLAGTVLFLPALLRGRVSRKTEVRFGPLLSFGAIVSSFCGRGLINWYWEMFQR